MNFYVEDGQGIGQEMPAGGQSGGHKGSVPAPINASEADASNGDRSLPLMKMKSMEVLRRQDGSMVFWSGSQPDEQVKQTKESHGDDKHPNESEPTASSVNKHSDAARGSFNDQVSKQQQEAPPQAENTKPADGADAQVGSTSGGQQVQIDQKHKEFAKELFQLQNKARKEPKWIIKHLKTQIKRFQGLKLYSHTEQEFIKLSKQKQAVTVTFVQTHEGQKAYQDAIAYLEKQRAMPPLKWSQQLYKACKDHAVDVGPRGITSSTGSDASQPIDRISRHGNLDQCWSWADSCIFGALTPLEALERLIVCDGQPQRGFREAIFNHDFKLCGICCNGHTTHENVIQLLYVDKLLAKDQPKENKQPLPADVLELAMNQDVQIVCNEAKSQVMKELNIGPNVTKVTAPLVPRARRSPANFKQPPKVMRSPGSNKLATVKSAQTLVASSSQKTFAHIKSPRGAKHKAELFDARGNLIGSDQQTFGLQLKKYTEKQQQSVWFADKPGQKSKPEQSPPQQNKAPNAEDREASVKNMMSKHSTAVKTMQVKLPPALREARLQQNKINNHYSPRTSPKKSTFGMKEALSQLNSPLKSASREPLRLKRSPLPRPGVKWGQSPPAKVSMRSPKPGAAGAKQSPVGVGSSQRKKWNKPGESALRYPKNKGMGKVDSKEVDDNDKREEGGPNEQGKEGQTKASQYILVALELQKEGRNPLSAQQALRDPVKTYKLELAKPNASDFSSKSQLKSPTRCGDTATTSGNIGSLTRAEGDILVRQKSPFNRCRSPPSVGSKIGSGTANLFSKGDSKMESSNNGATTGSTEQRRDDFSAPLNFLVNEKDQRQDISEQR